MSFDPNERPPAVAYVNNGRWVARCTRPGCMSAEAAGPRDDGRGDGGLHRDHFECSECGWRCDVEWPAEIERIERLLAQRPLRVNRNWMPGEPVLDLVAENVMNGLMPVEVRDGERMLGPMLVDRRMIEG